MGSKTSSIAIRFYYKFYLLWFFILASIFSPATFVASLQDILIFFIGDQDLKRKNIES
jgi:hypothetical protein